MVFKSIEKFNKEIIGIDRKIGSVEDKKEFDWMIGTIHEEIEELQDAHDAGDFIGEIDAVIDAIYFLGGFLTRMGISHEVSTKIFQAIHKANMCKKKGKKEERVNTHDLDAVKPEGWTAPEMAIIKILDEIDK